jgi:hypothetical protein
MGSLGNSRRVKDGNVDPLSQTSKLNHFRKIRTLTTKLTMAEESQPVKRYKLTNLPDETQSEEPEPIGVQIPTQLVIPVGEEAKADAALFNEAFMESDARKTIDDNLIYITQDLPKFRSRHGLTSGVITGTAETIQAPLERVHAYYHIRKALTNALPLLEASAIEQAKAIPQTKLAVSTAILAMEEHDAHVRSVTASMAAGETETDADLAEGLASSPTQQDTSKALKTAYDFRDH